METTIGCLGVRLDAAVEQAPDVVLITDLAGLIQYVNPAFGRATGYSREEAIGHHVRMLKSGTHDAAFYRNLWKTLSDGQIWRGTFVNRRKDGCLYEAATVISPVQNDAGLVVGYLAVTRDVTGERQRERQVRHARAMDALSRLAGGVAHDFNNALMTIMGHLEMLEARLGEADGSSEEIVEIKAACDRSAVVTRQLLAFDRRTRGDLAVLDVNRAVAGLEKMLRRLLGEDVALVVMPSPRPALVRFEVGQIEQVLMDLAVRERELMPSGGRFSITVCEPECQPPSDGISPLTDETDGWTTVRVRGTGLALDASWSAVLGQQPAGFEAGPSGIAGLGLESAQESIQRHGGRMTVHGGQGGEVTVTLYLRSAAPDRSRPAPEGLESDQLSGSATILLAEDELAVRDLVRGGLSRLGYLVLDAPDGATAMERAAFHDGPIDLLITDVVMPGMTGHELAGRLRALHPGARIIYMSGYPEEAVGLPAASEQGALFLQKPFTREVLARKIREALTPKRSNAK